MSGTNVAYVGFCQHMFCFIINNKAAESRHNIHGNLGNVVKQNLKGYLTPKNQ